MLPHINLNAINSPMLGRELSNGLNSIASSDDIP